MSVLVSIGAACVVAFGATAQTPPPATTTTSTSPSSDTAPSKWPYGIEDVVKLSRAQISEDITLNYVQNSGTIYNLSPKDIVALRNEGVSDKVINTMLDQRKNVPADVANQNALQAQAAASAAPAPAEPSVVAPAPVYVQPQPFYVQPQPAYVPPEPDYVPASTLFIIPDRSSVYPPYGYPSFYFGSSYGCGSTVYTIGSGYGYRSYGHGHYGHGYYGAGRSTVHYIGRR